MQAAATGSVIDIMAVILGADPWLVNRLFADSSARGFRLGRSSAFLPVGIGCRLTSDTGAVPVLAVRAGSPGVAVIVERQALRIRSGGVASRGAGRRS